MAPATPPVSRRSSRAITGRCERKSCRCQTTGTPRGRARAAKAWAFSPLEWIKSGADRRRAARKRRTNPTAAGASPSAAQPNPSPAKARVRPLPRNPVSPSPARLAGSGTTVTTAPSRSASASSGPSANSNTSRRAPGRYSPAPRIAASNTRSAPPTFPIGFRKVIRMGVGLRPRAIPAFLPSSCRLSGGSCPIAQQIPPVRAIRECEYYARFSSTQGSPAVSPCASQSKPVSDDRIHVPGKMVAGHPGVGCAHT